MTSDERLLLRFKDTPFEKPLPAQYMSDGTLRLAALLTLLHEPNASGLLGLEEPENELHPRLLPGLAEALGVPYRRALVKNNHLGRSFIVPTQKGREDVVKKKLNPIREFVVGKKVAVVDDSIVRGTTSRRIVRLLREAGATEVYFISSAPPIVSPCIYGIDMAMSTELIAANNTEDEIARHITPLYL